ncbi:MAG TPA: HAD family hydrolase [Methylomirabilota bacterium]
MNALLVDLDDTLLDYSGGVSESWQQACEAVCRPRGVDAGAAVEAIARTRRWFWDDPDRHRRERTNMLRAWTQIAVHGLAELGVTDQALAGRIAEAYAERRWARMALFPGVLDALAVLRDRGVPLALVTNGDVRQQRRKIEQHDLARFFDVIVFEGEFGCGKPDEKVYRHALAGLGARPDAAWMIGDHLEFDVLAPQRLGLRGVWVDAEGVGLPPSATGSPHRIVRAFCDLVGG